MRTVFLTSFFEQDGDAFARLREAQSKQSSAKEGPKKKASSKFVFKSKAAAASAEAPKAQPQQLYLDLGQKNFSTQLCTGMQG